MSHILEEDVDLILRVTIWFFSVLKKFSLSETSECSHCPARFKHPEQDLL